MNYYYADSNNQTLGPVSPEELRRLHVQGVIAPQTYVVPEGATEWKTFAEVVATLPPSPDMAPPVLSAPSPMRSATRMGRFRASWQLFRNSLILMSRHKKLMVFPIVIFLFTVLICMFFIAPVAFQPTGHGYFTAEHWSAVAHSVFTDQSLSNMTAHSKNHNGASLALKPMAMGYVVIIYFVSMFFATFFNVAFYHEILGALRGENVSLLGGMRFAVTKLKSIMMWTLFAGLVGLIIKTLEERLGLVGRLVLKLIGMAWSVAAVFVIPVIVCEESTVNPILMLKRSALALKRTWGESLIGYAGMRFGGGLILVASLALLGGSVVLSVAVGKYWMIAAAGLTWLFAMIALVYLMNVAEQIYRCVLFNYASKGTIPELYSREMIDMAWKTRKLK